MTPPTPEALAAIHEMFGSAVYTGGDSEFIDGKVRELAPILDRHFAALKAKADLADELAGVLREAVESTVNSSPYPDGPNMDRDIRVAGIDVLQRYAALKPEQPNQTNAGKL